MAPTRRRYVSQTHRGKPQSSIYRGVSLHKGTLKYRANIKIKGKKIALGAYDNEVDAAKAFDRAALRYRGARAELNFASPKKVADPAEKAASDKNTQPESAASARTLPAEGEEAASKKSKVLRRRSSRTRAAVPLQQAEDLPNQAQSMFSEGFKDSELGPYLMIGCDDLETELREATESAFSRDLVPSQRSNQTEFEEEEDTVDHFDHFRKGPMAAFGGHVKVEPSVPSSEREIKAESCLPSSNRPGPQLARLTSQPSVHSHGLNVLDAYGFNFTAPSQHAARYPIIVGGELDFPEGECMSRPTFSEYRNILLHRSMADLDEEYLSEDGQWSSAGPMLQPVTFSNSPMPCSKNAWWKRKLQAASEKDARDQMLAQGPMQPAAGHYAYEMPPQGPGRRFQLQAY